MNDTWRRSAIKNLSHGDHPIWRILTVLVVWLVLFFQANSFDNEWWVIAALGGTEVVRGAFK